MPHQGLTISEVALRAGVNVQTVRFYERKGLIQDPPRTASGYRIYSPEDLDRLCFIKRAKTLGFSLREIGELLSLRIDPCKECADVRRQAEAKIAQIEAKVRDLRRMKRVLEDLVEHCEDGLSTGECPVLKFLDPDEESLRLEAAER